MSILDYIKLKCMTADEVKQHKQAQEDWIRAHYDTEDELDIPPLPNSGNVIFVDFIRKRIITRG